MPRFTLIGCTSIILTVLSISAPKANAQNTLHNSGELIQKGIEQFDKDNFKGALGYFLQVPDGDTNYSTAKYEIALSYLADSAFEKAKQVAFEGMKVPHIDRRKMLYLAAHAYDYLGKADSAAFYYDSIAHTYPTDNLAHYEKSIIYFHIDDFAKATQQLEQALMMNPYHYRSHAVLGNIYLQQGRLTEAYLATTAALLFTNDMNMARSAITTLSAIAKQTTEASDYYTQRTEGNELYEDIDEIIHAKLALNTSYKVPSAIGDEQIVKVAYAIMETLSYDKNSKNFAMQYYVPIFREVYEKNMFDPFILLLFSNYGIESVEQYAKKQKRDISEVKTTVFSYWDRIIATRMLDYTKRAKAPMLYSYEQANNLYVAGNLAMEEGKVVFKEGKASIYEDGYLAAEGNFNNNGKKEGAWRYYYSTGLPRLTETYKNGVMQGEARQYRSNGFLKEVRKYNSAGEQTETQEYTYNGILSTTTISKGEESEYIVYHPDGKKRKTFKIKNKSLVSGQYRSQYSNGSTEEEMEILDGKRNGVYKEYYENGKLSVLANFRKGDRHGMFTTYYENGNKKSELNYNQGKADGERISYNEKGQITSKTNYSNGELNGVEMQLSGGKEYYSLEYRNGIPLSYTYRGPDGVEVKEASKKLTTLKLYHPNGNLKGNLPLKDGQATGLAKYYFQTGGLREDVNFENDVRHGVCTEYYKNGKPYIVANYIKGERTGWYKEYHTNGKLRAEGWLTDDNKEGQWKFYSVAGKIESEAYYRSGDEYGPVKHYDGNGKAEYMDYYDNGMIMRMEQYDNTGKIILEQSFPLGTGKYRFIYPNGNTSFEAQLKNGFYEGAYTYYYPDKTLKEKGYYKNGKKDSLTINYFPGGQESTRGSFRDGRKNGKWTYYRYDGKLEREIDFVKGEEQGKDKVYQYGELRNEYNMEDNAMEGDQLFYGEDKKLAAVYNYKNYDLAGYTYEGADGKLKPLIPIKNGTVKIASYYPNGKKAIEASIIENMYDGKITTYYSNGNIAEEKTYTSTDLNGAYNRFHPNGNPSYEATYKDDVLNGTEKIYDEQGKPLVQGNYVMGERHGLHIYNDAKTGKNYKLNYDYGRLLTIENK